jgi:hypothetical protein
VIGGQNQLPEAVVTELCLINPMGIGNPGVVDSNNLRAKLRLSFRPQHGNVPFGLQAVPKEIAAAYAVVLVK